MTVGFTITDFKGHEKEAVEYIQKVCILESPDIAQNIVDAGPGVNIFPNDIDIAELQSQPFSVTTIETQDDKYLLVSAVNFNLELLYNDGVLRLVPTEYVYIEPSEVSQFEVYIKRGLVKLMPDAGLVGQKWILEDGSWDDNGIWVDSNYWRDSE